MTTPTVAAPAYKRCDLIAASSWPAVLVCAPLAVGAVCLIYVFRDYQAGEEPFAWFDGTSSWPSIAIFLFAALLSIHLIVKIHFKLKQNAAKLTEEFGLNNESPKESWWLTLRKIYRGWDPPELVQPQRTSRPERDEEDKKIDVKILWHRYLSRGRFWVRLSRAVPMFFLYLCALYFILPLIGHFPTRSIRGNFHFDLLIGLMIMAFLLLTFVVIDAVLLHEGFLKQLAWWESSWPETTFKKYKYIDKRKRKKNENSLADYWDILLIAKRTEAIGDLVYYPFVILSLLIVANYFGNWTWPPVLLVALTLHFSLALFAAWRLPKAAREYREKVLARLKRRRRQDLMHAQRLPEVTDTMIEEVQSTHQGAFCYLWEQPAIRALLLPSGGVGLVTLLQYLPH